MTSSPGYTANESAGNRSGPGKSARRRRLRACLLHQISVAGPHRVLSIIVDAQHLVDGRVADRDLMASIGHELQHAVEVLNYRSVRSSSQMILLYKRICDVCGGSFETYAAARAGNAVRDELARERSVGR